MSHAFEHNKCSWSRGHLSECLKCSYLWTLQTAFKEFCSNNGSLLNLSLDFSNTPSDMSALRAHRSISLDVSKVSGMLAGNAKRIFCNASSAIMSQAHCNKPADRRNRTLTGNAKSIYCKKTHVLDKQMLLELGIKGLLSRLNVQKRCSSVHPLKFCRMLTLLGLRYTSCNSVCGLL